MGKEKYKLLLIQYYLIFWIPFILLLSLLIYYLLTFIRFPTKTEIRLPEEYKLFLELIQRADRGVLHQKKIETVFTENIFRENPFIESIPKNEKPLVRIETRRVQVLKLTSIISHERKICIINQKLYQEGDKIGNIKIEKIGDYYVELLLPSKRKVFLEVGSAYTFVE